MQNIPLDFITEDPRIDNLEKTYGCKDKKRIALYDECHRCKFHDACQNIEYVYFGENSDKLGAIKEFLFIAFDKYKYIREYYPEVDVSEYTFDNYLYYHDEESSYSMWFKNSKKGYKVNRRIIESMIKMMNYLVQGKVYDEVLTDIEYLGKAHRYIKKEIRKVYNIYATIIRNSR